VRVLVNTDHVHPEGGLARSAFENAAGLAARGHEVHLVHLAGGDLLASYREVCASEQVVRRWWPELRPARRALPTIADTARSVRAGIRVRPDVVHTHRYRHTPWAASVAVAARAALVCHLREEPPQRFVASWRAGMRRVDRFVAVSGPIRDAYVAAGVPADRIEVVANGVDPGRWQPVDDAERRRLRAAAGIPDGCFVAVFAGRIDPDKGLDVLAEAWRRLDLPAEAARLVVAGDIRGRFAAGEGPAYLAGLESRLGDRAVWLGHRVDMAPVYGLADVVVVPSRVEPFGRVTIEALACGLPVIASRVGGIPEVLTGELAAGLVPSGDPAALADAIDRLRRSEDRAALGAVGRRHVAERFSMAATLDGREAVFAAALAGRRGAGRRR
jgi:glycosyltransferase involved in cell wall biosynthesis